MPRPDSESALVALGNRPVVTEYVRRHAQEKLGRVGLWADGRLAHSGNGPAFLLGVECRAALQRDRDDHRGQ